MVDIVKGSKIAATWNRVRWSINMTKRLMYYSGRAQWLIRSLYQVEKEELPPRRPVVVRFVSAHKKFWSKGHFRDTKQHDNDLEGVDYEFAVIKDGIDLGRVQFFTDDRDLIRELTCCGPDSIIAIGWKLLVYHGTGRLGKDTLISEYIPVAWRIDGPPRYINQRDT